MAKNERALFEAALALTDAIDRETFLDKACQGDTELRARVEALLKSHAAAGSFLDVPVVGPLTGISPEATDKTLLGSPGENDDEDTLTGAVDLSFLQPSKKPGAIGRLGHYEILQLLGHGGFGIVLKAFDEKLHRLVAIKVMNVQMAATSPPRKRFLREARSAAAIKHENIVQVYSVEEQPLPYIVMEFVDGETLEKTLNNNGPLEAAEVLFLARQMANGLAAAHAMGLIHRDIKPGNILLENGVHPKVKITDFGLARAADDASLTQSGFISGTPMYMAPEQALGLPMDQRTDLFSLGSVLYRMACGRPPFRASNTLAVLRRVTEDTPRALQEILPQIPDWLVVIVNKLLAKKPEERYQTSQELADLLARCESELQLKGTITCVPQPYVNCSPPVSSAAEAQSVQVAASVQSAAGTPVANVERTSSRSKNSRVASGKAVAFTAVALLIAFAAWIVINREGTKVANTTGIMPDTRSATSSASQSENFTDDRLREVVTWVLSVGGRVEGTFDGRFVRWGATDADKPLPEGRPVISLIGIDSNPNIRDEDLARLANLPDLENLSFSFLPITDRGMELLGDFPKLKSLSLDGLRLTEKSLDRISRWTSIEELSLDQHEYTDRGLSPLTQLKQLRFLRADLVTMTSAQTAILKQLPSLQIIWLRGPSLSDETMANVAKLPRLTQLVVTGADEATITNEGARYLAQQPNLASIQLPGTAIDDTGLGYLAANKDLTQLLLDFTKITDEGLGSLSGLSKLKYLVIGNNQISDDGLAALGAIHSLAGLTLNDTAVTDAGLPNLYELSRLEVLNLDNTKVTAAGVAALKDKLPNCKISAKHLDAPPPAIAPFDAEQAKQHQEAWAKYLNVPVEYTNSIGMKFRLIPPGEFLMGSTQLEIAETISRLIPEDKLGRACCRSESPQHKVKLTQPFYLSMYEVTQTEYETILGRNPSQLSMNGYQKEAVVGMDTARHPVESMAWRDAADFCARLSQKERLQPPYFKSNLEVTVFDGRNGYRFPSEAEWEFACRAGTTTRYWSGDTDADLSQVGWTNRNSGNRTHAVGELHANPFGLYDIHGNVREYCQDWFVTDYYSTFADNQAVDPSGPPRLADSDHLIKGGGAQNNPTVAHSAARYTAGPVGGHAGNNLIGIRVALSVDAVRRTLSSGDQLLLDVDRDVAWWALAGNELTNYAGYVKVKLDGAELTFTKTEQLPNRPFVVTEIRLYHKSFRAKDLEKLVGLSELRRLTVFECPLGDDLTIEISRLKDLTYLGINNCKLTDVGMQRLSSLTSLAAVDFNHQPGVTDSGFAVVRQMPRLTNLSFINASITDKGLVSLRGLSPVALYLPYTRVTDAGMPLLAELQSIEELNLAGTEVSDEGVAHLTSLPKLKLLALQKTGLTDQGLKHLEAIQSLQTLYIGGTKVTASGIASLQKALPNCKIGLELSHGEPWLPVDTSFAEWMQQVASKSADGQVVEVVRKLRELNPEFDGKYDHKVEKGVVTELILMNPHLADISPVRALTELKLLNVAGSSDPNSIGQLTDLSPLAGMTLSSLDCSYTQVKDLSPLQDMPLTRLFCSNTHVDDLSQLAQMPLTELACAYTDISDLAPLKGMPLTKLDIHSTHKITDLSALQGLPLTELIFFHNTRVTDLSPLKGMKLTTLDCFTTGVTDLSPIKGMPLTFLQCANTKVSDLSPLEGMPLTGLFCFATQIDDLSPLQGMPLKSLLCNQTLIDDDDLKKLYACSELSKLNVADTKVTPTGIELLRKKLPNCEIVTDKPTTPTVGGSWHSWPADAPPPALAPFNAAQAKEHQEAWARYLNVPVEYTNSIGMKFRLIPPGEFLMGSSVEETERIVQHHGLEPKFVEWVRSETPQHKVILTQPFYLSTCEVTQAQFKGLTGENPSPFAAGGKFAETVTGIDTGDFPVDRVFWDSAARFNNQLSEEEGLDALYDDRVDIISPTAKEFGYRLPTEAEWEFACRAGTQTLYWTGDENSDMTKAEWRGSNSDNRPHPVGQRVGNPFGMHDMHGNVREWCQDAGAVETFRDRSDNSVSDPLTAFLQITSPAIIRGGDALGSNVWDARAAVRQWARRDEGGAGFRVRLSVEAVRHLEPRDTVKWILSTDGNVELAVDGRFYRLGTEQPDVTLPRGNLVISTIGLGNSPLVRDEDLTRLANLPALESLSLISCPVTDRGLANLGKLPRLKALQLDGLRTTARSLDTMSQWTSLESLSLSLPELLDSGLAPLANLINVKFIRAGNLAMSDGQTEVLARLPKLKSLWLMGDNLSDETLRNVAKLPHLTAFTVTFAEKSSITNEGARALAANERIISVNLDSTKVDDQGLAFLAERQNWEEFLLDGTRITDSGLAVLKDMQALRTLWLSKTSVGDLGLEVISSLSSLEVLHLNETQISDAGLKHLEKLQQLTELRLDETHVSPEAVAMLREALPKCRISAERLQPQ